MAEKLVCGMRYVDRSAKTELTCTLERGHEKPVHEMLLNGKFLGGWVDQWSPETQRLWGKSRPKQQKPPLDMPPDWRGEPIPVGVDPAVQGSLFEGSPSSGQPSGEKP